MPKIFDYICCKCHVVVNKQSCKQPNGGYKCWNCSHWYDKNCANITTSSGTVLCG